LIGGAVYYFTRAPSTGAPGNTVVPSADRAKYAANADEFPVDQAYQKNRQSVV
jgi:hypothetical protein